MRSGLVLNSSALTNGVSLWGRKIRAAASRLRDHSPIAHGVATTMVSAFGVYLNSRFIDPLVFYTDLHAICWPIDGLLIGVLLLCSRRNWPWIMAGYVITTGTHLRLLGEPVIQLAGDTLCNVFEMVFAAAVLPAFNNLSEWLRKPRLILRFSVMVLIGAPLIPALVWSRFAHAYLREEFWSVVGHWLSGDALGIALYTPLVLVLASRETYQLLRPGRRLATLAMFGVLLGASWFIFHQTAYPIAFLIFPILVVMVNWVGFPGAVLAVNAVTIIAAHGTISGAGPFMFIQGHHEPFRIMTLQVYLTIAMVMSFAITLTARERDDFQGQLKLALEQMEVLATHDSLTGLGNRRLFDQTLDAEWSRARRQGMSIGLLLLDADHFKSYNDMYGHLAGDHCLCAIAHSIVPRLKRAGDLAARYGGEEFVVLLPGATLEDASTVAASIREGVEALGLEHKGNASGVVTVSIGFSAVVPDSILPSQRLIAAADEALYAAKQGGRNRVVSASSTALTTCDA
ncbi:sensor domain-containing diguanylate cyclase [Granulicella aggregans]|uniref:sensor domain-containing diguanylate cyclase n=1 Tax=Granulicella aggregans TaxID=474949 RepID=UPI0021DFD205|nr:diguanylate cyclase [Granulicella aggregans]